MTIRVPSKNAVASLAAVTLLAISVPFFAYADTGIYGNDAPDVILCHTIDGDIQAATPPYKDVGGNIYYNFPSTGFLEYDSSTGDYVDGDVGGYTTDCVENYHTILADGRAFYYVQPAASTTTSTSTASTTPSTLPNQDEYMFLFGVILFFAAVPFWERTLTVSQGMYDVQL